MRDKEKDKKGGFEMKKLIGLGVTYVVIMASLLFAVILGERTVAPTSMDRTKISLPTRVVAVESEVPVSRTLRQIPAFFAENPDVDN